VVGRFAPPATLKFLECEGDRNKVVIYYEAGKELAPSADMQHNKNYSLLAVILVVLHVCRLHVSRHAT
jgi:hypothetical protein